MSEEEMATLRAERCVTAVSFFYQVKVPIAFIVTNISILDKILERAVFTLLTERKYIFTLKTVLFELLCYFQRKMLLV